MSAGNCATVPTYHQTHRKPKAQPIMTTAIAVSVRTIEKRIRLKLSGGRRLIKVRKGAADFARCGTYAIAAPSGDLEKWGLSLAQLAADLGALKKHEAIEGQP